MIDVRSIAMAGLFLAAAVPATAQGRVVVLDEPAGTAVGMAIFISAGGGWETESEAGLTLLAARSIIEELRPQLEAVGGLATVECDRSAIAFTVLLPKATWRTGAELFLEAIFHGSSSEAAVDRARAEMLRVLAMEEGSPAHEVRLALQQARFGSGHRWARSGCGRSSTVSAARVRDVNRIARLRLVPSRATAAIAGPVDTASAGQLLRRSLGGSELPLLLPSPPSPPAADRRRLARNTVTTFLGLAYPIGRQGRQDADATDLLAFLLREEAMPGPARSDIYDVATEVERHGGGGALMVYLVTSPAGSDRWLRQLDARVRATAARPMPEPQFRDLVNRYRGARLLELAGPDGRARDAARQLFHDQRYRPPDEALDALTPERLSDAAARLGRPASALIEPE